MRELAPDVWQLGGFPPQAFNVYLIGDVLVDAATRWAGRRIFSQLRDHPVSAVALTHVHPDHQGVARAVCERYTVRNNAPVPLCCHAADAPVMEGRQPMQPDTAMIRLSTRLFAGPAYRVERTLAEGDTIAGFRVLHTPGHTPGHVTFFREADRVAIVGDVLNGMNLVTTWPDLHEPPAFFTSSVAENRRSIRRLAELRPALVLFGHGPPLRDPERLQRFAEGLPDAS